MSTRQVIECDRCGAIDGDETRDRNAWGRVYAATVSGHDRVGSAELPADLCGDCIEALVQFVNGAAERQVEAA